MTGVQLAPGTVLAGRYEIEAPIATGAMGAVYRAADNESGEPVALKQLLDRQHAVRVEIEARVLERLSHPGVVGFLDHFDDEDAGVCLVMDLVDGQDLEDVKDERGGTIPFDEAAALVAQAAEALDYVHSEQTVHRDVKPRNLVLGAERVVMVDFGIAREVTTATGTSAIGSPGYMAPETLAGEATPRSDVYGLGATLWTLIKGEPPPFAEKARAAPLAEVAPPEAARAIASALELDPVRRLPSAAALASAVGHPISGAQGASLALSTGDSEGVLETFVRTVAGVFDAAAASIALRSSHTDQLVYQAAWGAGAAEVIGLQLSLGEGIAGAVAASGEGEVIPACREDPRFAAAMAERTGYVPNTMVVAPLLREGTVTGVVSILDRRDGAPLGPADLERAELMADVAAAAIA